MSSRIYTQYCDDDEFECAVGRVAEGTSIEVACDKGIVFLV